MERAGHHWVLDTIRGVARVKASASVRVFSSTPSSSGARASRIHRIDAEVERLLAFAAEQVDPVIAGPCSELASGGALTAAIRCKALDGQRYLGLFNIEDHASICAPSIPHLHRSNWPLPWGQRGGTSPIMNSTDRPETDGVSGITPGY